MNCQRVDASRGNPQGTLSCSFLTDSFQNSTYLLASSPGDVDWNIELVFFDENGQVDKAGNSNYALTFPAATEQSNQTGNFNSGSSLSYDAATDTLSVTYATYTPGALDSSSHSSTGIFMGAMINGQPLPPAKLALDPKFQDQFLGTLNVAGYPDGKLEFYFYDAQGHYDSNEGANYSFTLRRK
jgi:flagellar hook protein FlgE